MAIGTIANGDSGSSARAKINAGFAILDAGVIGGTLGSTANAVPVASGTGGKTLQATPVTIDPTSGAIAVPEKSTSAFTFGKADGSCGFDISNSEFQWFSFATLSMFLSSGRLELENGVPLVLSGSAAVNNGDVTLRRTGVGMANIDGLSIGTQAAKVGGIIFDHYTDVASSSVNGTEDDLYADTLPANTLAANGQKIVESEVLTVVSSATAARRIKKYFAGTLIFDSGSLTLAAGANNRMLTEIIRESSSVARVTVTVTTTSASTVPYVTYTRLTGLDFTTTNILKTTGIASGTGAAVGDITEKQGFIEWLAAA